MKTTVRAIVLAIAALYSVPSYSEDVQLEPVHSKLNYSVRGTRYGDKSDQETIIWVARSNKWVGPRPAYCVEPGTPLHSGKNEFYVQSMDKIPVNFDGFDHNLIHMIILEHEAQDDMNLATGNTTFKNPGMRTIPVSDRKVRAWRMSSKLYQDLVVLDIPWSGLVDKTKPVAGTRRASSTPTWFNTMFGSSYGYYDDSGNWIVYENEETKEEKEDDEDKTHSVPIPPTLPLMALGLFFLWRSRRA